MTTRMNRSVRAGIVGLAVAATAALTMPAVAHAEPVAPAPGTTAPETTAPGAPSADSTTLPTIPGDAELADLVKTLKETGGTQKAKDALTAILSSDGQLDPSKYLGNTGLLDSIGLDSSILGKLGLTTPGAPATPAAPTAPGAPAAPSVPGAPAPAPVADTVTPGSIPAATDVLTALQKATGASLLTPAIAPLCTDPTANNPLGLATAPALAVPGPWPTLKAKQPGILDALTSLLPGDNPDLLAAIKSDETAYAIVPPSKPDSDKFQVAWFNTSTLNGGLADLLPLSDSVAAGPLKSLLSGTDNFHGIRLAKVKTGQGTILSAVFGTTTQAGRTCFFLPAVGAVKN